MRAAVLARFWRRTSSELACMGLCTYGCVCVQAYVYRKTLLAPRAGSCLQELCQWLCPVASSKH